MTALLETKRRWLRPLELADAAQIQILFPHWELVKFLAGRVPWPYPADGALTYCRDIALPAVERGEEWHWTLRLEERSGAPDRRYQFDESGEPQPRILARPSMAGTALDDRSLRRGHRILVRHFEVSSPASS